MKIARIKLLFYLIFFSRNCWKGFKGEWRLSELSVIRYYFFLNISTLVVFEMKVKTSTLVVFELKWCPMLIVWFVLE